MVRSVQNKIIFSFVLFVFVFSFVSIVEASSFGSLSKTKEVTLFVDESKSFDLLFWSSDGSKYDVIIEVLESPDFAVLVNPNNFPIDMSSNQRVSLPGGSYVSAVPVKVFVKSEGAEPGTHVIKLSARTLPSNGILVFSQERIFDLKINVIGPSVSQVVNENLIIEKSDEVKVETEVEEVEGLEEPQETNYLLYIIAGVGILSIAYVIYRYA